VLGRREWDLTPYVGKQARLEIVDDSREEWGHILVDEVVQWAARGREAAQLRHKLAQQARGW